MIRTLALFSALAFGATLSLGCDDKKKEQPPPTVQKKGPKPPGEVTRRVGAAAKQLQGAHSIRDKRMKNLGQ